MTKITDINWINQHIWCDFPHELVFTLTVTAAHVSGECALHSGVYCISVIFVFLSMVALAMVKDGEHGKTHTVNILTFNNAFTLLKPRWASDNILTHAVLVQDACLLKFPHHHSPFIDLEWNHQWLNESNFDLELERVVNMRRFIIIKCSCAQAGMKGAAVLARDFALRCV